MKLHFSGYDIFPEGVSDLDEAHRRGYWCGFIHPMPRGEWYETLEIAKKKCREWKRNGGRE